VARVAALAAWTEDADADSGDDRRDPGHVQFRAHGEAQPRMVQRAASLRVQSVKVTHCAETRCRPRPRRRERTRRSRSCSCSRTSTRTHRPAGGGGGAGGGAGAGAGAGPERADPQGGNCAEVDGVQPAPAASRAPPLWAGWTESTDAKSRWLAWSLASRLFRQWRPQRELNPCYRRERPVS
jgi:hypothetical protein